VTSPSIAATSAPRPATKKVVATSGGSKRYMSFALLGFDDVQGLIINAMFDQIDALRIR